MFLQTLIVVTCLYAQVVFSEKISYFSLEDFIALKWPETSETEVTTTESSTTVTETEEYSTTTETEEYSTTTETDDSTTTIGNLPFDYCQVCDVKGSHTVCQYPKCELSGNCTLVKQIPLNSHEKQLIVKYHNELRNKVAKGLVDEQPSASNMQEMEWDNDLEYISQCWANQCKFEHDVCRDTQTEYAGQNIVYHGSTLQQDTLRESLKSLIDDWFNEYVDLPNEYIQSRPFDNPTFTNHYTQLVWAETNRVGCARVYAFEDPFYTVYLYCNYAPRGNDVDQPIYIVGLPATDCHKYGLKKSVNYSGLCK